MTPLDVVQRISLATNHLGAAFYFAPDTLAKGKELGLDGFRFYMIGRGGVLGDVKAPVVGSAFAYFHPAVVERIWTTAKEKLAPHEAAMVYGECCAAFGRSNLSDVDGLEAYNDAAEALIAAIDPAGLSLYAGWAAEPLVDDAPGRAMQLAAVLRELRGSVHIVAILASGLTAAEAHAVKRPDDTGVFGWDPAPEITDEHRSRHDAAEALTDEMLGRFYQPVTDDQGRALVAGTEAMSAALGL